MISEESSDRVPLSAASLQFMLASGEGGAAATNNNCGTTITQQQQLLNLQSSMAFLASIFNSGLSLFLRLF
jgi:hypothetical protein